MGKIVLKNSENYFYEFFLMYHVSKYKNLSSQKPSIVKLSIYLYIMMKQWPVLTIFYLKKKTFAIYDFFEVLSRTSHTKSNTSKVPKKYIVKRVQWNKGGPTVCSSQVNAIFSEYAVRRRRQISRPTQTEMARWNISHVRLGLVRDT